jgi:8-oxo-dGTP pyrophosphatase MutT (NUDIX family)
LDRTSTLKRHVVPVDAASLVILRGRGRTAEVLMGRRRPRAAFLPNVYVFPGGRLDRGDAQAPPNVALRPEVEKKLRRRCRGSPALALALAALRETFEETGLLLCGAPGAQPPGAGFDSPFWRAYGAAGLTPDPGRLDYIVRAITPPGSPRRYNTRFFITRGDDARGALLGDGELLDLRWVRMADVDRTLDVVDVTSFVLKEAAIHMSATPNARARRPATLMCYVNGRRRYIHE